MPAITLLQLNAKVIKGIKQAVNEQEKNWPY
jgi:hypothetical protein